MRVNNSRFRIFTWHIHGTYLYYLSKGNFTIYIPVNGKNTEGYYGRGETFPFGDNVIEVPVEQVKDLELDCILFQTNKNFLKDQYEILSEEQRKLPRVYVEHDPPSSHATDTIHIMNDPEVLMVHVTHYNRLMWHNTTPVVRVIEHGIPPSPASYSGKIEKGIVVINNIGSRGRKLGADIYEEVAKEIPLDLIGMGSKEVGGLGEVLHPQLPEFISQYRFFFNPIRYTSMGLAVCEAMMCGLPVVALATTEYASVFRDGISGYIHTDVNYLVSKMRLLLEDHSLAEQIGKEGQKTAELRFSLQRFINDWEETFRSAITKNVTSYEKKNRVYK